MKLDMTSHDCTKLYRYLIVPVVGHGRPIYGTRLSHIWDAATHHGVFVRRLLASLALLLALGSSGAWAQTFEPGFYFIASRDYAPANTTTNFYLCPTEGWYYYQSSDPYYTNSDNGMPFMTTYQCRNGEYDALNAIWSIEKVGETNYYYIKHVNDGKYLTYNRKMASGNEGRMRMHLEASPSDNDAAQFQINWNDGTSCYEITTKKENNRKYLNPTGPSSGNGNINSLVGTNARSDGPSGLAVGGIIGLWTGGPASDNNSKWYLEDASSYVCETPTITYNESTHEVSMSTATDGATIYYTTDGTEPTSSSTPYTAVFTVSSTTNFKAIAVKAGKINSMTASKQVVKYTYIIVNSSGNIATQYTADYPVAAGTTLSGYASIPEDIRSPYISDETITFKSFEGDFSAAALEAADGITETPTTENIYITYTTGKLGQKLLHLQGVRPFNLKNGSDQYFVNSSGTTLTFDEVNTETTPNVQNKNKDHIWYISGGDPYAVTITCPATSNYLTSTPSVTDTENTFFVKSEAGTTVTFQDASGSIEVTYNEVKIPTSYYLIDKAGKILLGPEESTSSLMAIPSEWKSPLATYHYWKSSSFNESDGVYTLKAEQTELSGLEDLGEGDHIYITYDVKSGIDIQGSKTYLLKFSDGAEDFHPENGDNGVSGTAIKAVYPYNNGDFNLYIYGATEWTNQLSNGASTRTRWLWYFISNHNGTDLTGDDIDPYHVIIKSRQNQVYKVGDNSFDGNAYLYTYKPNDGVGVVTGVITQHDVVKTFDPTLKPTEYMLLGTDVNHMTLKTVNEIDGAQQTVNKFEQYWKNYPTVQTVAGVSNPTADNATLTAKGWHRYQDWAYAEPWGGGTKTLEKGNHWFETVSMGSGVFSVEEVTLEPEVILLDQHGWEIARVPVSQTAKLKQYDSPMVEQYQWYPKANKVPGYHKFTIPAEEAKRKIDVYKNSANPANNNKVEWHVVRSVLYTSTSLSETPEGNVEGYAAQDKKYKTDFYVTYTVKSDYAGTYVGAAAEGSVKASSFFLKQAGKYAQNSNNTTIALVDKPSLTGDIPTNVQWKVKPNFNIDHEMGYKYLGETGAQPEAKSKDATELDYVNGVVSTWSNGFDPYNVQIQSVSNTARYFTTNTGSTVLDHGIWTGTGSTTISLREMSVGHISAAGNDHTTLDITNATFMVVDDGNGNMRLMPRFDNTKIMSSFTGLSTQSAAAPANDDGKGTQSLVIELVPTVVSSTDDIISMKGYYILAEGFTQSKTLGTFDAPFEGTIDGQLNHFSFTMPLVKYAKNATIRNVILEGVTISSGSTAGNVGAICCEATGDTRIYNCGINHSTAVTSTVSGSNYVGGIVGLLAGYSRVINCYSYANITGGTVMGGIVGYNDYASTAANLRTMVMNCMFYGDLTGSGTRSPIFGGYNIANLHGGLNTFNYYAYQQLPTEHITGDYNSALSIDDKYLNRFEFYRQLLNSNKRLAAYYATGSAANANQMAKWVLETADRSITEPATPKPYPVLKAQGYYPSIINYDVENAPDSASVGRNKGGKLGKTLKVHLSGTGITTSELTIDRTDKDFDRFNFNYDKIQLPYFNDVGTGNYTNNQVVTGWEITSMTGGTEGTYETGDKWNGYNFADRNCTNKDLVGKSGRIFSQGAYFDVPYGVTDIFIRPHWATAAYVADEYLDVVYNTSYTSQNVSKLGKQFPTGKITINGSEQVVYKTISAALTGKSSASVYDLAIVLVGNLHQSGVPSKDNVPFTIMSVDEDNDHEPDYSMIYHHTGRTVISPIRFDFINIPGTCQAQKPNGVEKILNFTIFKTKGWFETTNTCLVYSNQVEYENKEGVGTKANAPLILLGGDFEQFVSTQKQTVDGRTTYIHVGGNVYIQSFGLGTHGDGKEATPHIPVSVTGGEYKGFYLTGTYNPNAAVSTDNAECYISGGHFVEAAGACQEKINGNVQWQIYDADIDEFFGGGINDASPITGSITTEIYNSHVGTFCGGPKFGNMTTGKAVTTTAVGCVFDEYFGAGYGGLSYSRLKYSDEKTYNFNSTPYQTERGKYYNGVNTSTSYGKKGPGVATDFDYEFFVWSTGETGSRKYIKFASFSLAQCDNVSSTLTGCTVNGNYYGGGSLGKVVGTATSVLDNCTVKGNVFGGGFSAHIPKVAVRNAGTGLSKEPSYNSNTGMFEPGTFSGTTYYEWKHVDTLPGEGGAGFVTEGGKDYVITKADLTTLGQVAYTDLTVRNNCQIDGGVFGGGDESAVNQNTLVKIENVKTTEDPQNTILNVYGGGNTADVDGNTEVNMTSGTVLEGIYGGCNAQGAIGGDAVVTLTGGTVGSDWGKTPPSTLPDRVFGGGLGEPTLVNGNVTVSVGTKSDAEPPVYAGTATVWGNVYGGSALGNTNATRPADDLVVDATKKTNVYLYSGTIHGEAYGGGLGQKNGVNGATSDIVSIVGGDVYVLLDGAKVQQIFGANNLNGTPRGHVTVHVKRTVDSEKPLHDGATPTPNPIDRDARAATGIYDVAAVYGGGNRADYIPTDALLDPEADSGNPAKIAAATAKVIIEGCDLTSIEYVYGGGNAAAVPATDVTILGDYIINYVFGGGNGKSTDTFTNPGANIGTYNNGAKEYGTGKAETKLVGGHIMYVFGGSDTKGNVRGGTSLSMPEKTDYPSPTYDCCDVRDVKEIYGAGNEAEQDGDVTLIMGCVSNMDYVYGGARNAHVKGGVDLVVTSGHFKGVFGGNNIAGTIQGPIKVTIEETGCDPLIIDNLYLGGNQAAYSVYGYKDVEGTLVARTSMTDGTAVNPPVDDAESDDITEKQLYRDPILNIVSCTSIGNAFGGGYGTGAVMYGNPTVNVNMIPGDYAKDIDRDGTPGVDNDATALGEIGNVYGGGEEANVEGNTTVNIVTEETVTVRSHMGGPVATPSPTEVKGALITGNVFGAGKGKDAGKAADVDLAFVTGNTTINMKGGEVKKSIYGGGELSQIGGDSHITVSGGTIGTTGQGEAVYGNVYGGGLGQITNALFGLVKGNTNISIKDNASILHNIYGGGAYGSVGTYTFSNGETTCAENTGTANITVTGGTIGTDGHENGMVFGSSRGDVTKPTGSPALDPNDHLAWVNATNVVVETAGEGTTLTTPLIKGSVYGSGENGHTYHDTNVTIHGGTIGITDTDIDGGAAYAFRGNVYGGGCGTDMYDSNNDTVKDTYNPLSGIVKGNATVLIDGGHVVHNVYGAGAMGSVEGNTSVTITGDAHIGVDGSAHANGYVYAAAKGDEALDDAHQAYVGSTTLNISGGTVWGDAFGGGQSGIVKGAVDVNLTGGTLKQDVYGGGALAKTNTMYDGSNETYKTYVTNVVLNGSTVMGNVYGGGLGRIAAAAVGTPGDPGYVAAKEAVAANVNGPVTVKVTGGKAANVFGCNNLNGAPQQTVAVTVNGTTVPVMPATYAIDNVYGGGNQAAYTGTPSVTMAGGYVNNIYGGGLGSTAIINGGTTVAINGGTVTNDVFGGGSQADVTGNVNVSITGGTVVNDVYGGGALANTNTGNWDAVGNTWAEGKTSASNTTSVTLTGGTVGNVYGGGLGAHAVGTTAAIEPKVYGDIAVTVNPKIEEGVYGTARFLRALETHEYEGTYKDANNVEHTQITTGTVYTKGCVFGANNKEGTPKGNIQVTVYSTTPAEGAEHQYGIYEIQNVYGGGNLSAYEPADGKTTHVDIHGCDRTSIQFVFGGGNAASVPETNVTIWGSYEIETVFGGGNGSEPFWDRAEEKWVVSPGAAVTTSNVFLKGGYIHSAFGGSYERGTVETTNIDKSGTGGECTLRVTDVFGGGKDADVVGGITITISDCTGYGGMIDEGQSADYIKNVYAGSYNARVLGDVNMTVTSGNFTNVFGGNHTSGFINGTITINIEETEECKPVIIENLYGGGNFAHYPGPGAKIANPKITINVKAATRIGNIYGGCNHADVTGDTEININMMKGWWAGRTYNEKVIPNSIGTIGNVYGGGNEGKVTGNTTVNIGTENEITLVSTPQEDNQTHAVPTHMVAKENGKYDVLGAHITGNVFGGCNLDDVTGNTTVNICTANYSGTAGFEGVNIDNGSVYGGGNAGDVLGNTSVTMAGGYVFDGVYGGGLHGSVGTFTRDKTITTESNGFDHSNHKDACIGKPTTCTSGGTCTVLVSGGQVGPVEVAKADGGMKNTARYFKKTGERNGPVDYGFVFGAGRGEVEDPSADVDADFHCYVNSTNVTISGTALIMASVYGGGENGRVLGDTHVTIAGGQIGCGEKQIDGSGNPIRYAESAFINPLETLVTVDNALAECPHWDYTAPYMPHDPLYFEPLLGEDDDDSDAASMGSDGHTYYGNVFGGGSGYYPYEKIDKGEKKHDWLRSAGLVEGNTVVDITGGHILTNVYGGNETTDVLGKCTINMTGGTIGVPRTLAKIADHPVTCYLFGAGKGDQRTHFNTWTDVDAVEVNVSGGIVYGSVFGGGEDGHVVNNVKLTVEKGDSYTVGGKTFTDGPVIGTWGTSYVEGNVFGGGRGFSGEALTAGNVGGNISLNVSGGFILGSVYGGGRLASVGYSLVAPEDSRYGKLQDGDAHGNVAVTISGGVIGNDYEYSYIDPSVTGAALTAEKAYMPHTLHDADNRLTHTKGGNVFAGGMGRLYGLDGTTPLLSYDAWQKLGKVKSTTLTITGGTIKSNVYGGSEFGFVGDMSDVINNTTELTHITISGGTIGSEVKDDGDVTRYTFGSVYGGGYGSTVEKITPDDVDDSAYDDNDNPKFISGRVHGSTNISMTGGTVLASIYGGGEVANVRGSSTVTVSDGTVGKAKDEINNIYYGGATMGNVYGGGNGSRTIVRCGQVFGNALVTISGGTIYHNVYGGGAYGSVGDIKWIEEYDDTYKANKVKGVHEDGISTEGTGTATIVVTGGTIGVDGRENGMVFGSSRGDVIDKAPRDDYMAWVYDTHVTIGTAGNGTTLSNPLIKGSVYGGGENGHTFHNTDVKVHSGTIGNPAEYFENRGNVYGAGCGTDTYTEDAVEKYKPEAGIVYGNTSIHIDGGQVSRNVYGAGALGTTKGSTTVTITGDAVIGDNLDNGTGDGNVYGAARGYEFMNSSLDYGYAGSTAVTINGGHVKGSVFGGGEAGVVKGSVVVNMNGGTVGKNLYGGGALSNTNTDNVTENYGADTSYANPTETIPSTDTYTTTVNLLGGTIQGNAYGGGLGRRPLDAVGTPGDPDYKPAVEAIFAKVYGDVTVDLNNNKNGKPADGTKAGCAVTKVFGCNDMHGTPRGRVRVHVYATQHPNRTKHATISSKYPLYDNIDDYTISNYAGLTTLAATVGADVSAYTAILTDPAKDDDAKKTALANMHETISKKKYDVQAVYGGGDLARYEPVNAFSTDEAVRQSARVEVIIDGCALTSIHEVYGSGNASATPASSLTVYGCYEIDELFGGGNGKDPYQLNDGYWYANPGANVGYRNYTHYVKDGTHGDGSEANPYTAVENTDATSKEYRIANYAYGSGEARTDVFGGRIHSAYGGSNMVGNIRFLAMSSYDSSSDCPSNIDHTYAGGNKADMDGKAELLAKCVGYMHKLYGGNTNADYNNDIVMTITNGVFGTVIGGNDQGGKVSGSITINIKEGGCNPIIIDKLYGGGYEAGYSIYGYNKSDGSPRTKEDYDRDLEAAMDAIPEANKNNETVINKALIEAGLFGFPKASPRINIISATKIGEVYGGGYNSVVVGNPTINVNMEKGQVLKEYVDKNPSAFTNGKHTLTTNYHEGGIDVERNDDYAVVGSVAEGLAAGNAILKVGTIGTIFGGGDQADVIGNTTVEIGTGSWFNPDTRLTETLERKAAFVLGNVYGGGRMGNVGNFTKNDAGHPTSCVDGTGIARVVISNGEIGPDNMKMYHADGSGVIPAADKPDDSGHVFGGGMGTNAPADDNAAFVDSTEVIINGRAWVKGSVFGGGENGHVLHDAGVKIGGKAQIGNGHILIKDGSSLLVNQGINRPYTDEEWAAGRLFLGDGDLPGVSDELKTRARTMYANSLPECHSWEYKAPIAPYDKYAGTGGYDAKGGAKIATSGRAFNGNVFGGGSGFFPYKAGSWNPKAGQVEGDTWVEITGGHIMTSLYGGSEMTSVTGDTHIIMSGGTVGVPRTLSEIAAHPVTCYVFGGGKGEERSYLDSVTTVNNAFVNVSGGWVYGSVFGGAEDGAVLGNAKVTIGGTTPSDTTTFAGLLAGSATKIGTWGTSYVDGNIFGGGRGYEGKNPKAGRVGGNINIDITGGRMLGSVYGGGRLGSVGIGDTGAMQDGDDHGIITINATGGIIGNDHEYTYSPDASLLSGTLKNTVFEDFTFNEKIADGESTTTVDEAADAVSIKKLYHTKGGSIYGGSMGRLTQLDGVTINPIWHQLGIAKATTINFSGNARVMSSLFGGSEFGKVSGDTHINVSGSPVIGTVVEKAGVPQYTFGSIYAGGYGSDYKLTDDDKTAGATKEPRAAAGLVEGNTYLNMSENAKVLASVYGGGKLAVVNGNTDVRVSGGEVGLNLVRKGDGYVMFGGDGMGNVYGGGRGRLVDGDPDNGLGLVKGNTNVTISGGSIYHNVYGGGTLASVGTFLVSDGTTPSYIPFAGVPYDWTANTGTATVTVTGGTIGINGRDNGMVFGSSRGDLTLPVEEGGRKIDPYDRMAWVNDSRVNIGTEGSSTGPHITGTVYGGGENGHNGHDATVSVYSGTVGIVDTADPWYSFADAEVNEKALLTRGNVYGAGCGTDTYTKGGEELHNPKAGMVGHSTTVNIHGGHIVRNVYGGGALGSVGMLSSDESTKHGDAATSFALSWPYALEFAPGEDNGKATVNVTGGHIGLRQLDGGDIFGGARGEAGDRYATAHLAYVRESEVNVNYPSTPALDALTYSSIQNDFSVPCITGSVHGSGENGFVYDDAHVNILNGLIGHSVYGGGKGKGTYKQSLLKIGAAENSENDDDYYNAKIYSLIAGKVFGNTYVTMTGGHVMRNVYGGGNMGSVGKGNYASGTDDYAYDCKIGEANGYGEVITTGLWDGVSDNSKAFLGSGKTTVRVLGGKVGYIDTTNPENSIKNLLPYGNIFGGSAGEAAPNILNNPRYLYSPAFFSGYVNETDVTIGLTSEQFEAYKDIEPYKTYGTYEAYKTSGAPTILGSVYGGGQDGHVRRDTKVTVNSGEIGLPYTADNQSKLQTSDLDSPQWLYRGNVYGAGSGITKYSYDYNYDGDFDDENEQDYSNSAGSVTRFTEVDINGGTIHRNVYGGGSLASVGPPNMGQGYDPYPKGDTADGHSEGRQSQCTVNIAGTIGSPSGYNKVYGGEVYGASRGITELKEKEDFSFTIWTQVNIFNGANIKGNVYGGGDTGIVKKNTEVNVGATRP